MPTAKIRLFAAILFLAATPAISAGWGPELPQPLPVPLAGDLMGTTIHRLSNGLTIYLSPNPQRPRIAAWIAARVGSKHDPADNTGTAHYLEHMLFKGSQSLGTLDYAGEKPHLDRIVQLYELRFNTKDPAERTRLYKEIDAENIKATRYEIPNELDKIYRQLGIQGLNAFTSNEQTVYTCDLPSNRLEAWAKVEADRFARPVFRLFQSELEAVYEEKNQSFDNPERVLWEALNKKLYKFHPYGRQTTLGSIEHLKNPSLAKMYEYYRRHYNPNNMAIALSGDFNRGKTLALLTKHFGSWQPKALPEAKTWPLPKPKGPERVEVKYESEEKVIIAWPTAASNHPDADTLSVMDMIMDNAASGIINLTLNQAQKVKAAGSSPAFFNDAGHWYVWALPKRGQTLEQASGLLLEAVEKLKAGEFTDEDIRAVITNFEVSEKYRLESDEARVSTMIDSFVSFEPWSRTVGRMDRLRRVAKQDVLRVARRYLGNGRVTALRRNAKPELPSIGKPAFTKIDIDEKRRSRFAERILSLPAIAPEPKWLVEGRDYTITPLPAGKIISSPNPVNDLFSLSFEFKRGSLHERNLCAALSLLDLSGAEGMSAEEYKKKLFGLGTSVSYGCGEQGSQVSVSGLDKNLWPSLELLFDRFESPQIAPDTLKKMVDVAIGTHQDNKKNPGSIANALGEFARRGKESSVLKELTDQELLNLKTGPLRKIINGVFGYQHRIAYVGNRQPGEIARLLHAGKKYKAAHERKPLSFQKPARPKIYFTHRDMVQSQAGIFAADEKVDPAKIVDYIYYGDYMGGDMSAVIFQEIRETRALAYGAWGGYDYGGFKGDENQLYGGLSCQADKTTEAVSLLRDLLRSPPFSEKRFAQTAKSIEEYYRTNPAHFRGIPGALFSWEDLGLPPGDPRPERFAKALKYKLDDLKSFASRFKDKTMTIHILGHRDRAGLESLKALGDFEEKKLVEIFPY
ncbi:MAG: hypothetical protein A3J74_10310 [Elusimicrobia bacterium RIFCSPHIGHO2_02_FULL_57_9]|nr:MAG: hypothetical protein A3J74_10310 [Elusimicrobia bacterium RIFCSPHIGHO2_02_FULL_57_9]